MDKSGITDNAELMKAVQMQDGFGGNLTKDESGILPAIANKITDESIWTDRTKYDNQEATIAKKIYNNGNTPGITQDIANARAKKLMKNVTQFKGKTIPEHSSSNSSEQSKPAQNKPAQNRPAQNRPAQNNQQQSRPTQNRPAQSNSPTNNPPNSTPV